MHSQQIDLIDNPIQTKEIKELIVEQSATGTIKISHPGGGTDDFADSLAIASYLVTEAAGSSSLKADFNIAERHYGIKTDINGVAFTAPSPEMISDTLGHPVQDNAHEYIKHPETGQLVKREDFEDDPDDSINVAF